MSTPEQGRAAYARRSQQVRAAMIAGQISVHHQACAVCQRGGLLRLGPGGAARQQCETERALFAALSQAREA